MNAHDFTQAHGDSAGWTTADIEAQQNLAAIDQLPTHCWFCSAPNQPTATICGFCNHHSADAPAPAA